MIAIRSSPRVDHWRRLRTSFCNVLQQPEEALHCGIVSGPADPAHGPDHSVAVDHALQFPRPALTAPCRNAGCNRPRIGPRPLRRATALSSAVTAKRAFKPCAYRVADNPCGVHVLPGAEVDLAFPCRVFADVGQPDLVRSVGGALELDRIIMNRGRDVCAWHDEVAIHQLFGVSAHVVVFGGA